MMTIALASFSTTCAKCLATSSYGWAVAGKLSKTSFVRKTTFCEKNNMATIGRLKLKNSVFVVPVAENHLQIRSGERSLRITGAQVELLVRVLEQLDEGGDLEQILGCLPEYPEQVITSVVSRLNTLGLLEEQSEKESAGFSTQEAAYYTSQLQFFSYRSKNRFDPQKGLKNARVTVIGLGRLGSIVASNLLSSGVGRLRLIDARPVDNHDIGPIYIHQDQGAPRAEVARLRLAEVNPFVELTTADGDTHTADSLKKTIGDCDLLVVCEDDPAVKIFEVANEACLQNKITWLGVSFSGVQGVIGPLVIPGETPCYRCYKLRERGNATHVEEYASFEDYLRANPNHQVKQGSLRAFDSIIGSLAALEVVYALTNLSDPKSLGNLLVVDLLSFDVEAHPILRLPRCPVCSPTREKPKRKVYDI
jgi:molybdopterin-synthase adenylyltransferase